MPLLRTLTTGKAKAAVFSVAAPNQISVPLGLQGLSPMINQELAIVGRTAKAALLKANIPIETVLVLIPGVGILLGSAPSSGETRLLLVEDSIETWEEVTPRLPKVVLRSLAVEPHLILLPLTTSDTEVGVTLEMLV